MMINTIIQPLGMSNKLTRIKKEVQQLVSNSIPNINCVSTGDSLYDYEVDIEGVEGTPYEAGVFKLVLNIPLMYPMVPPNLRFITKVYHPNIDSSGRICLDLLKPFPQGSWKPGCTLRGVLSSVHCLLVQPNPDDPLMPEIANEFKYNKEEYIRKALEWTKKYANKEGKTHKVEEDKTMETDNVESIE